MHRKKYRHLACLCMMLLLAGLTTARCYCANALIGAVKSGNPYEVQTLLAAGANVDIQDEDGKTPLLIAVENGNLLLLQQLIAWYADVNKADAWDNTPLLAAARRADISSLYILLNVKADPDAANKNGITPLIASVQKNNGEAVSLLLEHGANINAEDGLGRTALIWAVVRHNETIVRLLLEHGAATNLTDRENQTALAHAVRAGAVSITALLNNRVPGRSVAVPKHSEYGDKWVDWTRRLTPAIDSGRLEIGSAAAPVTIVEYTDLQCPYCVEGMELMKEVVAKYRGKVRLIIKNHPLPAHRQAMLAALYFQAIAGRDPNKAMKFQELVFKGQAELEKGEPFLKAAARAVGVEPTVLEQDIRGEAVRTIIAKDMAEAGKFRFSGAPAFLVNGIPVEGTPPVGELFRLIDKVLADAGRK